VDRADEEGLLEVEDQDGFLEPERTPGRRVWEQMKLVGIGA
jgi:hypothetical protein